MENDSLLNALMAHDDPVEWFEELAAENDPALQEVLREALLHPDREVRIYAAVMLAQEFHDVAALPGLVDALLDWNRQVQSAAAEAVWEIGDMDPAGLIRALHFERGDVRDAIVEALAIVGWFPDDVEAEVTYYIAIRDWRQLVVVGPPAVPGLISALSDPDGNVRRGAAWALGEIGDPGAVPWLIDLLADTSGDMFGIGGRVCDVAAGALVQIGTGQALEAVRSAFPELRS
jgi:HEAT repeat protein